ncbi:putative bifunctional diguanylate cyclase/phosphodiesterase [Prosthecomicrobium sp. N25]|uniref:putative bifunctional diguanylate cyclase/phosphodiesterase n=1 Tax=Prosthecomicrobium sp. N25 TaxID=3129254 RepID=UPI003077C63A
MFGRATGDASVVQSIAALVACTMLFLSISAAWTAQQSNDLAVARQVRLAWNGFEQEQDQIAVDIQRTAISDEVYRRTHLKFEPDFAERVFGDRLWRDHRHDIVLVVSPARTVLQGHIAGRSTDPKDLRGILADVSPVIDRLRLQVAEAAHRPAGGDDPEQIVGKVLREQAVMQVTGQAAIVAAVAIVPDDGKVPKKTIPPTIVVSVRLVAGDMLERLARRFVLPDLRFRPPASDDDEIGRAAIPVKSTAGETLGFLLWRPHQPGYQMMQHLAPLLLVAMALFVAFALVVVRKFNRRTRELADSEARATYAALHDALSGLANRVLLGQRIEEALAEAATDPKRCTAIVYVDLDKFKDINDTLGHQAGDEVIRQTGRRLAAIARDGDTAARISGDEFCLVIRSAPTRQEVENRLSQIVAEIARPVSFGERTIYPAASVGCAIAPVDGTDRAEIQHKADLALYRAKGGGRGRWFLFEPDMDDGHRKRQSLRQDLRAALTENRLTVLYQPFFSVAEMKAVGVEARVAWDHPTRGRISAGEFIPIAEECGLIRDIGAFILHRAARDAHRWPGIKLAVNISPIEMRQPTFAADLLAILADEGFDPDRLQVDITENILLTDADVAISAIETLRAAGVGIALDEFGSGQSSFNYLSRFRFDTIKIDRSFVAKLETSAEVATIVHSMVELAGKLGLETVAEGVETFGQFRFVQAAGCSAVQGHLCAKPMPAAEVAKFLERPLNDRFRAVA